MSVPELLTRPARQAAVLGETSHRPWPLPSGSWLLAQTWEDLLFAHWRVDSARLSSFLPDGLSLDEHDGSAWLGLTPFLISGFRFRGLPPLPLLSRFPELNVRTYVSAGGKPGIWFFSLDTPNPLVVEGGRRAFRLPYFRARISVVRGARIEYSSARAGSAAPACSASFRPTGKPQCPVPGSLEHFLTERYCLYALEGERLVRAEIHHPPWPLQKAEGTLEQVTVAPPGVALPDDPPLLHCSAVQDVLIWPLEPVVTN